MKDLIVLGSTGSIGKNTLDVVRGLRGQFRVAGLSARNNWEAMCKQAQEFQVPNLALSNQEAWREDTRGLAGRVFLGPDAPSRLVRETEADIVVAAMSGAAGLPAVLSALETGKQIALANKETLVMGGKIVMENASRRGISILPVDSEHSAIFQSLLSGRKHEVETIILTASGGALRDLPQEEWNEVTPEQALRHPNWNMGPKVTIDSASLMNKALEIIEAHWLFQKGAESIKVLIHPESIVHSMVQFCDGSVIAQLGPPDMRFPIQYALTYPRRMPSAFPRLDLAEISRLNFRSASGYKTLQLAYKVLELGGTAGAVLNAANEVAVEAFLAGTIKFGTITDIVAESLENHTVVQNPQLEDVMEQDRWARGFAQGLVSRENEYA